MPHKWLRTKNSMKKIDKNDKVTKNDKRKNWQKWQKMTKDGPGPVIVSDTLCPAVHILGT